jgi:hypothetical protein
LVAFAGYGDGELVEADGGILRSYVSRRQPGLYPTVEEFFVAAPAEVEDKAKGTFELTWSRVSLQVA